MANSEWIQAKQTKYAAFAATYIIVIVAVLVIANQLANRYNKTFDSTSNKRFSLSEQTDKIAKDLKQDVNITYYDQSNRFSQAKDLLDRYSNLSPKIHVHYVDVDQKPQLAKLAGITTYGTTVVDMGPKHEQAKALTEEGITGALIRDMKGGSRNVCSLSGSGEHQFDDTEKNGYSQAKDVLARDNYQSKTVSLLTQSAIPSDCTVVLVAGPTTDYSQPEVDQLRSFVQNGGHAMFLMDPPLKIGRSPVSDNEALVNLLSGWGITPQKDLVLDLNPVGQMMGVGAQVPIVTTYESQPIVTPLKGLATAFPLTRSLQIKNTDKSTVQKLFGSSNDSYATTNLSSPEVALNPAKDQKGPFTLGAAATYNTGKQGSNGRVVVIGTSNWATNGFLKFNGNSDLLLNAMNWLSADEDLISIRPKEADDRRLNLNQAQFSLLRLTSQFLLPLIVIVGGVAVWWRRR